MISNACSAHPVWHRLGIGKTVMVVEDHDGGHDAGGHHEHDAVEISACGEFNWIGTDWV